MNYFYHNPAVLSSKSGSIASELKYAKKQQLAFSPAEVV